MVDIDKSIMNIYNSLISQKDVTVEMAIVWTAKIYGEAKVDDHKKRNQANEPENVKTTTPNNKSSLN